MYKAVIFDVDGTLLDGTEGIIKSVKYAISEMGLKNIKQNELISFVGPPVQNSAKQKFNLNDNDAQTFANIFRKKYANEDVFLATVYDGIYDLLDFLKEKKFKLGVATYKREDYAINLVKHFNIDIFFDFICGADNNNQLTKSDIVEKCIKKLGTDRDSIIMIGDSIHDAEAAKNNGIDFIAVTYGFGFKDKISTKKYTPILTANNVYDIIEFFKL